MSAALDSEEVHAAMTDVFEGEVLRGGRGQEGGGKDGEDAKEGRMLRR